MEENNLIDHSSLEYYAYQRLGWEFQYQSFLMRNEEPVFGDELDQSLIDDQRFSLKGHALDYQAQPSVEGQCLLVSICPIRKSKWRFCLFVFCCILLLGVPYLLTFWYPRLKKKWYYIEVPVEKATHFYVLNNDGQPTYPIKYQGDHYYSQNDCKQTYFFFNRYLKYIVDGKTVKPACFNFLPHLTQVQKQGTAGYSLEQAKKLRKSYGVGTMILEQKDAIDLFVDEIMRPLYIFIVLSCLLWIYEEYFYYSIVIFVTAAFGIGTNLVQTYRINKKIFNMAYFETEVNILREGQIKKASSKYVVPGDIVFVNDPIKMPFDGLLLQGSILANECSITGESVPVLKKSQNIVKAQQIKSSYIFEGSTLIQINSKQRFKQSLSKFEKFREDYGLPIYVVRTNFQTMKGQLIRIISFPIERKNIFEKESVKFLLFLFILATVSYVALVVKLAPYADPLDLFVKFLDLVTVTVPPGLPVSMTFGIIFALEKMKQKQIFCTSPNKTIVGGMINMLCFDKTGTLTEDFMDFNALIPTKTFIGQNQKMQVSFADAVKSQSNHNLVDIGKSNPHILFALSNMATNHTIVRLNTTGQNVGDPMEVKMFEFAEFQIKDSENPENIMQFHSKRGHSGQVVRRFEFDSELFRMSTLARTTATEDDYYLYVKGSPEIMTNIYDPSTVPKNYHQMLKKYTCMGFRVLAIGHRLVKEKEVKLERLDLEKDIVFDGFEIFENRLKPETKAALMELREAQIPFVMITGDNALTASSIGFECHIFDETKKAYICHWEGDHYMLEKFHEHQLEQFEEDEVRKFATVGEIGQFIGQSNAQLCLTGKAFNHIFDNHFEHNRAECKELLSYAKVFARAKPNDKVRVISIFQELGKTVGMCGDGANDCGALKQAEIGLSLSQAEASISAPFTSQITNISSMVELIKECRAGLATNYSLFNIMAIYSLIQYNTVVIQQFFFAYPGDFHFLYWDVLGNFIFFLTLGYTGTAKKLTVESPNCSLFTISNLTQLMITFIIQMGGQVLMINGLNYYGQDIGYTSQLTYEEFLEDDYEFVMDSFESNILFLFANFMYVFTLLSFSISRPWRKQFYTNVPFTIILVLVLALSTVVIMVPQFRPEFMELSRVDYHPLLVYITLIAWGVGIFICILQKFLLEPFFNKRSNRRRAQQLNQ